MKSVIEAKASADGNITIQVEENGSMYSIGFEGGRFVFMIDPEAFLFIQEDAICDLVLLLSYKTKGMNGEVEVPCLIFLEFGPHNVKELVEKFKGCFDRSVKIF
ncbi:hypothetical protein IPA_08250 [Ignicoccus pacificus DSM 13166]|uniref:Uncharacterized protein n=1 Tax=Ignicoccus pacificus DSM 13166 TaxID=940294 RepID=A0A977KBV7_9CREN|nr:hypothetical protein IPA_08250 [Ignicoccus pacificus DSM 13166]